MFAIELLKKVFQSPKTAARRKPRGRTILRVVCLEGRVVPSLTPVAPNAGYPYTSIVELQATFPDHKMYVGSGVLIDRFHVLTAGHVVYSYADGGFASQIQAIPELYGTSRPYGTAYMTYQRTYTNFMNYNRTHPGMTASGDYDIALITLDRTIGDRTGWMGFGWDVNANFAPGAILNTAGYPASGGYDGNHMQFSYGGIAGLSGDGLAITYWQNSITAFGGQSGSPVWRYTPSNGASTVYGVHVGGNGTPGSLNLATRITQSIFNDIQNWRAADRIPTTTFAAAPVGGAFTGPNTIPSILSVKSGAAQTLTFSALVAANVHGVGSETCVSGPAPAVPARDAAPNAANRCGETRSIHSGVVPVNGRQQPDAERVTIAGDENESDDLPAKRPIGHASTTVLRLLHGPRLRRDGAHFTFTVGRLLR
jgi:V8-like Glu-specific endopeptidase